MLTEKQVGDVAFTAKDETMVTSERVVIVIVPLDHDSDVANS